MRGLHSFAGVSYERVHSFTGVGYERVAFIHRGEL